MPLRSSLFSLTRRPGPQPLEPCFHGSGAEIVLSCFVQSSHTMSPQRCAAACFSESCLACCHR